VERQKPLGTSNQAAFLRFYNLTFKPAEKSSGTIAVLRPRIHQEIDGGFRTLLKRKVFEFNKTFKTIAVRTFITAVSSCSLFASSLLGLNRKLCACQALCFVGRPFDYYIIP
jgi:hypothetical protein